MDDIREKVRAGYYKTKVPYPLRDEFKITEEVSTKHFGIKKFEKVDEERFVAAREKYRRDEQRLLDQFKWDCFEGLGIQKNPKREMCWNLAWEHGHSGGLHEVYDRLEEFAELIK